MDATPSFGVAMISEVPSNPQLTLTLKSVNDSTQFNYKGLRFDQIRFKKFYSVHCKVLAARLYPVSDL